MRRLLVGAPLVLAVLTTACASAGPGGGSRGTRNVISAEELDGVVEDNAFDVVQRLRPSWMRARGRRQTPAIFRDNIRIGTDIETLRTVRLENVLELRYIDPSDATTRWGTGFTGGVIQIVTRR